MFLSLAQLFETAGGRPEDVLTLHPLQLSRWLDEAWESAALVPQLPLGGPPATDAPFLGDPAIVGALALPLQLPPASLVPSGITPPDTNVFTPVTGPPGPGVGLIWHHLVYAYLIESTGTFEIVGELVRRLVVGETLGRLSADSHRWLRATEELFYRDPPLFSISGTASEARPSGRVTRRNAYWRMFGLDLPHAVPAWPAHGGGRGDWRANAGVVNTDFREKWSELLRQVWFGLENETNTSGAKPTDDSFIALLCRALRDMFANRRLGGLLAREEFVHVTALSWFHLTFRSNTPILVDLNVTGSNAADRLAAVAQRVGLSPAPRSRELFDIAEPMSAVLRAIELGTFDTPAAAATLYDSSTLLGQDMRDLVNLWQSATGERVKDRPAGTDAGAYGASQPLRVPAPGASNGVPAGLRTGAANGVALGARP